MRNNTRRILSAVIVLVMIMTGIDFSFMKFAASEGTSVGSTKVSETPETLETMGEWQYWVDDGIAIVAGYLNHEEESLTVPYHLGGYPVAGIGHRAFSENTGLKNITIHTNVTSIAGDAFDGLSGVTIAAYHGAYALAYAASLGVDWKNLSTVAEFAENAIDLTGLSQRAYNNLTDNNVVFIKNEATFLKVGQVVYFPAQTGYATGLGAKIISIFEQEGKLYVSIDRPDEGTIFKRLHLEDTVDLDWDHAILYNDCEVSDTGSEASTGFDKTFSRKLSVKIPISADGNTKVEVEYSIKERIGLSVDIAWEGFLGLKPVLEKATIKEEKTDSLSVKVTGKKNLRPARKVLADVPFMPNTAGFTGYISIEFVCNIKGEVFVNYTVKSVHEWQYKNGKLTETKSKNESLSGGASAKLKAGPEVKIYFTIGFAKLSIRFFELTLGLYYEAEASFTGTKVTGTAQAHYCMELKEDIYFEISIKIGIIRIINAEVGQYFEKKWKWDILSFNKRHWDYSERLYKAELLLTTFIGLATRVDKCHLKNRKVVFLYGNGKSPTEITYNVNDFLRSPSQSTPTRKGFKFDGWYVNTKESGLPGSDYKVVFGSTKMPFVGWNGTLYIEARWKDLYPPTSISLNKTSITGFSNIGTTEKLTATVYPTNANEKAVQWKSSNTNVATVDAKGNVKLKNAGTATITCSSVAYPNIKATCSVTVKQSPTGITLNKNNIFRYSDDMSGVQLTATVLPSSVIDKSVTWETSNSSVASVSENGYVTLKGLGVATITCRSVTHPNVCARCTVTIRQAVTEITLNRTEEHRTNANMNPLQLIPTVMPSNAWNKAVTWTTSNPNVATVSANGLVSMVGVGTATITCTSVSNPNVKATFSIEIIEAVREILLNETSVTCYSDRTEPIQLIPTILPANAGDKSVTWSTDDPAVATVDSNGLVTIVGTANKSVARATITCQSVSNPEVSAKCTITVRQAVTGITLNKTSIEKTTDEINPGYLLASVYPVFAYNKAVTWTSSDPSVASVTNEGVVIFGKAGHADITCRSVSTPGVTAVCAIDVVEGVTGLTLSERCIVRYTNQADGVQLIPTLEAVELSDHEVSWSTGNAAVATVSDSGIVYVQGVGTTMITCTSISNPNVSAECQVIVRQSVTNIELNESEIVRFSDNLGTVQLVASVLPADAANMDLVWESSDLAVATVDDQGMVSLVGPGTAVITCRSVSDPEIYDTCPVEIRQAVESMRLNITDLMRYTSEDGEIQLTAYVYPSYVYDRDVTWESSDRNVVDVSSEGAVTIIGAGEAIITCRSESNPSVTAVCAVEIRQAAASVTLNKSSVSLYSDRTTTYNLTATVLPETADDKGLIWTSSNPDAIVVSDSGKLAVVGTGVSVITCTAVSNPAAFATCTVTVKQAVHSIVLNETELVCYSDDPMVYQLIANVQPEHADNKSVKWTSSNTSVVTVSTDGTLTLVGPGTAVITCTSKDKTSVSAQCTVVVKQPMTAIQLDKSSVELFNDDEEGEQITAIVIPDTTDDTDVYWETDNEYVAVVSDTGYVQPVAMGVAHISCRSARNPETVYATCTVTVKQRVEAVEITGDADTILPGETLQLEATCYPDVADIRQVIWSSEDPRIATIDENGLVTAADYGTVQITATAADGGGAVGTFDVYVERELTIDVIMENDILYTQGNNETILASVRLTDASARRMADAGYDLVWTLTKPDSNDDVMLETIPTVITDHANDEEIETSYALLSGSWADALGSRTYTITCTAGPYTASADVVIDVVNADYAGSVTVDPSTITAMVGETLIVPDMPVSTDGKPVPPDTVITGVSTDEFFSKAGTFTLDDGEYKIVFHESGIYTATVHYAAHNINYDVNLTFYIQDEDGIIHIRTEDLELNESYIVMVEGTTRQLNCTATPLDAYDASVTWTSSDETVVQVDQNGLATAIRPGKASISCTANDGFGASALCAVNVESFLQLDDAELNFTVYTGGDSHADLGIVNVTIDSERRLLDAGLNVTWSLEKTDGAACDIALEEFRAVAEEGITVSGNRIKLLRINGTGEDTYRLTCRADEYEDSCVIHIRTIQADLPAAVVLNRTEYTGVVGETVVIDPGYSSAPLPEGTEMRVVGGHAFESALSSLYDFTEPEKLVFDAPGTYLANVVFSGDNYSYSCPITIVISDEEGNVPVNITDLSIAPEYVNLLVGEQAALSCVAEPANAVFSAAEWSSSDTSVATVSQNGIVTAIGAGIAFISATVPESDFAGGCMVSVEDGLTLEQNGIERTVFVDGITRVSLDSVQLTAASSQRQQKAPTWTLTRTEGNNLTLKVKEYNTTDADGNLIYGCSLILYSMSRGGDTSYELTCSAGDETVTIPITIHAVSRRQDLPSGLTFSRTVFEASVNELIQLVPDIECLPTGTLLPNGMRVALEGNALFENSLNTNDCCVTQSMTTLSFNRAGVFDANFIYSYSNIRYIVPVTFRIMDGDGNVPILATSVTLSDRSLWLTEGETAQLNAVFTPADADDRTVSWVSTDPTVASVDDNGMVTALRNGYTDIICIPDDSHLSRMSCSVWVEDWLSLETGEDSIRLYRQGSQTNEVFSAELTQGTVRRLNEAGIIPAWELTRLSGNHSEVVTTLSDDAGAMIITSAALISGGTDEFRLTCTAGTQTRTFDFTIEVIDIGSAPESIGLAQPHISASVGQLVSIDFTPVCNPSGTQIPQSDNMWSLYSGIGQDFYNAIDMNSYIENGDHVTVRFTRPGNYLLSRQFFMDNLHYEQVCEITVGQPDAAYNLLKASTTDTIVYTGGKAGTIADVYVADSIMLDVFDGDMNWLVSRVSGDSLDIALRNIDGGVELFAISADHPGEDVWRVTCAFGDYSESIDIRVSVLEPRSPIPETIALSINSLSGMMGDWIPVPLAVSCSPAGSALPETGDDFWSFQPMGLGADVCTWEIEDGILKVKCLRPGYYTGTVIYEAGNFKYSVPLYMAITDEEGVLEPPAMELFLQNMPGVTYANGQNGIVIGSAWMNHGIGTLYAGETAAYMNNRDVSWSVRVTSGSAAVLSVGEGEGNSATIVLDSVSGPGTVEYEVTCTVSGTDYTAEGVLTVLDNTATHPDPTLGHSVYYAVTGEKLTIPTILFDRRTGDILQGIKQWVPDEVLIVIGHEYIEKDDILQMTFYKEGMFVLTLEVTIGNLHFEIPITVIVSDKPTEHHHVMRLPSSLTTIDEYAFEGTHADEIDLRGTRITAIGAWAFKNCTDLTVIYIPSSVTSIGSNAFYGCLNLTIVCEAGSRAESYAQQNNIPVRYE